MFNLNICSHVLVSFLLISHVSCDWSWGSKKKVEVALEAQTDGITPEALPSTSISASPQNEARSSSINVPQAVLPLEIQRTQEITQGLTKEVNEDIVGDEGRSGRILGIPDRLCKLGVKSLCDKQNLGYPPALPSDFGNSIPVQSYNNYVQNVYPPLSGYPNQNVVTPKPSKGLFSSLFKNKKKDTIVPTYIPSSSYGAPQPSYAAPQPVYKPPPANYIPTPVHRPPVPSYGPPKRHYEPIHKISYKQPISTFDTPKPHDVIIHELKGQHSVPKNIITHAVHPSKVQHIHTHTHIYPQNPGIDIRDNYNLHSDDGGYESASQIRSIKIHNAVPSQHSLKIEKVFIPQAKEKSTYTGPFIPSQEIPLTGLSINQGKRHISATTNAFNTFGAKTHHLQQHQQQQLKQQAFQKSIDKLTASFAQNGLQRAYPEDCQCVQRQYCAPEDLVSRSDSNEIRHLLDARNEHSEVLSNSSLPEDYYDYDYIRSDVNDTYDGEVNLTTVESEIVSEDETTTESLSTEATTTTIITTTTTTTKPEENSRVRRETKEENKNTTEDLQGRQLTGFSPGLNGCGPDYVCCRRPVYIAAKRSDPICGRGNPSIHGRVASFEYEKGQSDFGEYPWQAAILRDEGQESMFVCGATLIDDRHVLTAAHCVNDLKVETLKVRLGEWDVNRDTEFYNYVEERVSGVFIHPEFYKGNLYNDIAVLRLVNYVDIDSHPHISPVCLPPPNTDFTNYRCHVTGWGKDAFGDKGKFQHILKELEIPVIDHTTCEFALQNTRLGRDYKLHRGFICAGGEEGKDACKGDGGGPLVCATSSKTFQLAGVVSWGVGCGQKGVPGVYVNIPYYAEWIRSTTRI